MITTARLLLRFLTVRGIIAAVLLVTSFCSVAVVPAGTLNTGRPTPHRSQTLTFAERVYYQHAIEQVYGRHRIWPKDNPEPNPPLEEVMPLSAIEDKVRDYMRKCRALETHLRAGLEQSQLQAEMDRMSVHTADPGVLKELWAALEDDPYVIAECLVRPILADQSIRGIYTAGEAGLRRSGDDSFDDWWAREQKDENDQSQLLARTNAYEYRPAETAVQAASCSDNWEATLTANAPAGKTNHTAIWTGSEMIVWGGHDGSTTANTGGRYNPATDTWTPTSTTNAPSGREGQTAIWTGAEMLIWGGSVSGSFSANSGGRYNPATDTWRPTSIANAPVPRLNHTAVWTGTQMIVCGGYNENTGAIFATGGRYNPATDLWTPTSTAPGPRSSHTAVWTGGEMIVWGGYDGSHALNGLSTGDRYDPAADTWRPTSMTAAPSPRRNQTAVWTGSQMVVWGGLDDITPLGTGGRFNPASDTWSQTAAANAPAARRYSTAVWSGSEMIVWGGSGGPFLNTGGLYNPDTDTWNATSTNGAPAGRYLHTAVWTGNQMIVWGGLGRDNITNTGGLYCAAAGADFSLGFQQTTVSGTPGTTVPIIILINRAGEFGGNITITPPDASGIKVKPPDSISTTGSRVKVKLKIKAGAAFGPHQLTFTGRDDSGRARTATVTLVIQ